MSEYQSYLDKTGYHKKREADRRALLRAKKIREIRETVLEMIFSAFKAFAWLAGMLIGLALITGGIVCCWSAIDTYQTAQKSDMRAENLIMPLLFSQALFIIGAPLVEGLLSVLSETLSKVFGWMVTNLYIGLWLLACIAVFMAIGYHFWHGNSYTAINLLFLLVPMIISFLFLIMLVGLVRGEIPPGDLNNGNNAGAGLAVGMILGMTLNN